MVWRTDGRTDEMNLFTELLVVEAKKNDKLNRGIPVDTKRSFSFVPYLLWYPGGQELGYLILELYIESY